MIPERWNTLLKEGEQTGTLQLLCPDGTPREVEYIAKTNVLPVRHVLVLRDKTAAAGPDGDPSMIPSWVQDYALFLLDPNGEIAAWYAGAERIFGYRANEAAGKHVSMLYPAEDTLHPTLRDELKRSAGEGHKGTEGWRIKQDGSRFWANAITMSLKDANGQLQGFASVVRDFSDRHERDEKLRRSRPRIRPLSAESTIAGVVSGEFDRVPEANDTFLELVGYTREDLIEGRLVWADLTPPEYLAIDELAHEEGLRFGACTPFEKELIRKDGMRVPVLVTTAVLQLSPFRWITFVTDLRERDRQETIEDEADRVTHEFPEMIGNSAPLTWRGDGADGSGGARPTQPFLIT